MGKFSISTVLVSLFACFMHLIALGGTGHAGDQTAQPAEVSCSEKAQVRTPEQAGKIFLRSVGRFVDKNANTSKKLTGRTVTADFADGNFRMRHVFHADGQTMTWEALTGPNKGKTGTVPYQAFDVRPEITLVMARPADCESVALIIDDNRGAATGFLGRYSSENTEKPISMTALQGPIIEVKSRTNPTPFMSADDLAGSRFTVVYPNEVAIYEHIYLNKNYMTWLGHKGTSAGVADTERYEAVKIAPLLYLVAWNEEAAPIQISFLFDFENKRELAVFFGFDESSDRCIYQTTSSKITQVMHTTIEGLK